MDEQTQMVVEAEVGDFWQRRRQLVQLKREAAVERNRQLRELWVICNEDIPRMTARLDEVRERAIAIRKELGLL